MKIIAFVAVVFLFGSCIEEVAFENESFESALVIDATLTNENKVQEIYLSRTYRFEDGEPIPETNANVSVVANGVTYSFSETKEGSYASESSFAAQPNIDYELIIETQNGRVYRSAPTQLTQVTEIDNLYAVRETNDDGVNGMSIYVDSFDPTGSARYYRYEYEETFKIIAPDWKDIDLVVLEEDPFCLIGEVERPEEQRICYRTETSAAFNLKSTATLTEDRVQRHLARFISSDDYRLSYRYSILVKQFVQTEAAYNYYQNILSFSEEGSLFSQVQPGFVSGNMVSETNSEEKVIGFFEVASVTSKRIFFDYTTFYPNSNVPPYVNSCDIRSPDRFTEHFQKTEVCGPLIRIVKARIMVYYAHNNNDFFPYQMVPRVCGDCTVLGSSEPPEFWVE